ncbi:MAG: YdcF family protein [Oscillospiraceae bacterium]|nr:YdcF family protein [Oscillospiraceae bacterium]
MKELTSLQKTDRHMRIAMIAALILFVLSVVLCFVCSAGRLEVTIPHDHTPEQFLTENETVRSELIPGNDSKILVIAKATGLTYLENGDTILALQVYPGGIIYNRVNFTFSGYQELILIVQIYLLVMTVLTGAFFFVRSKLELYSYTTLFAGGAFLFLLCNAAVILLAVIYTYHSNDENAMLWVYDLLTSAGAMFLGISSPFLLVFALALTISNLVLIRREGLSVARIPGLLMSFLIVMGIVGYVWLANSFQAGSEREMKAHAALENVYALVFAYLETMLVSACICGLIAARRRPAPDKTHILILGCRVGEDGKPLPLLRGRIDAAIRFAQWQQEQTGEAVCFVPSGGQGTDEIISEAGCMRNYLIEQGIPESRILVEDKSTNTLENMRFSLAKIRETCESPRIAFATTNYHVLRSGIIALNSGIRTEGVGARTGWYFWPNAFIREFIGLLVSKWKLHIIWLAVFCAGAAALNLIFPL